MKTFTDKLIDATLEKRSIVCLGLDPQLKFMPPHLIEWAGNHYEGIEAVVRLFLRFNQEIIDFAHSFVVLAKPNIAFYELYGHRGLWAYEETIKYAQSKGLLVIGDAKRGDGGDTAKAYAIAHIGETEILGERIVPSPLAVDAVTIETLIGSSCIDPFVSCIKKHGRGAFVVTKTSFKPNSKIEQIRTLDHSYVWKRMARLVAQWGEGTEGEQGYRNLGVVLGATFPDDAPHMRKILPNAWYLIPGYGAQGGGADGAVIGINSDGLGGTVNSSRGIIAAWTKPQFKSKSEDFAKAASHAAQFARDDLTGALKRANKCPWL